MKLLYTCSIVVCLLLTFSITSGLKNGTFENWLNPRQPAGFFVNEERAVSRTEDAYGGKYALRLSNYYSYVGGSLTSGSYKNPGYDIEAAPVKLRGYYKYLGNPDECGQATAWVELRRNSKPHPFKTRFAKELGFADKYTYFELPIEWVQSEVPPETIVTNFSTTGFCQNRNECCYLYLDNIEIEYSEN